MVLTYVQVYQCDGDGCKVVAVVDSNDTMSRFKSSWADTTLHQFCPKCRDLPASSAVVKQDLDFWNSTGLGGRSPLMDKLCPQCSGIGLQILPNGLVSTCRRLAVGETHDNDDPARKFVRRSLLRLRDEKVPVNSHLLELATTLCSFTGREPAGRDDLITAHFKWAVEHSRLRHFHKAIEDLRKIWLLPVGSRKDAPAGYWIMTEQADFEAWVTRSMTAPITQLTTIHRVAKANFPVFAEQLELEFFNDIQAPA